MAASAGGEKAESKQDGESPARRKVKRRVSAKAVDNTWAVKANVPSRQLAKSLAGGGVEEGGEAGACCALCTFWRVDAAAFAALDIAPTHERRQVKA